MQGAKLVAGQPVLPADRGRFRFGQGRQDRPPDRHPDGAGGLRRPPGGGESQGRFSRRLSPSGGLRRRAFDWRHRPGRAGAARPVRRRRRARGRRRRGARGRGDQLRLRRGGKRGRGAAPAGGGPGGRRAPDRAQLRGHHEHGQPAVGQHRAAGPAGAGVLHHPERGGGRRRAGPGRGARHRLRQVRELRQPGRPGRAGAAGIPGRGPGDRRDRPVPGIRGRRAAPAAGPGRGGVGQARGGHQGRAHGRRAARGRLAHRLPGRRRRGVRRRLPPGRE